MTTLTKKTAIVFWAILSMSISLQVSTLSAAEGEGRSSYKVESMDWTETAEDFVLLMKGDSPPTYTMYELFNPFRLIIDIADASIDPAVEEASFQLPKGSVTRIESRVLEDKEPFIARFEFFLSEDNSYTVDRSGNDIIIQFAKKTADETVPVSDGDSGSAAATPEEIGSMSGSSGAAAAVSVIDEEGEEVADEKEEMAVAPQPVSEPDELEPNKASVLYDIEVEHGADETTVLLKTDGPIEEYKTVELPKNIKADRPDRMYIDVKNVKLAGPIQPISVGTAVARIRTGSRSDGFRVVFDSSLDRLFDYKISEETDGLSIAIKEPSAATTVIADLMGQDEGEQTPPPSPEPEVIESHEEEKTIQPEEPITLTEPEADEAAPLPKIRKPSGQDDSDAALAFAGYNKQRITVDFYKIDLHNVFRLFGEISNLNIVVDEAVGGSLTLALNDVPWDFALDIILNLKDLQKEERYNTIVISPKSKRFEWPERTLDAVEFKADETFDIKKQEEESIQVSKQLDVPETVVEAKNLIHQAQNMEKLSNYARALELYEDAYGKWPENTIIAKRIAALCLVRLGQNAKAVHYAKMALKDDPADYDSALQVAIGLARMKKTEEATEYFEKAVGGSRPSNAALVSYSAFSEEHRQYDKALSLLKRHEDLYGDTLETMISKARVHDKQGNRDLAAVEYRTILLSGYEIPADLARYIKGRVSLAGQ